MGEEFVNGYAKGYKEGWDKAEELIGKEIKFLDELTFMDHERLTEYKMVQDRISKLRDALAKTSESQGGKN